MSICKNCCKEFKYQWCLDRHLRRKIPCKMKTQDESSDTPYEPLSTPYEPSKSQCDLNIPQDESSIPQYESLTCKYCLNIYSRKDKLKAHMKICNEKNDHVRCLEIELNTYKKLPINRNECRFCNKNFAHKTNHTRHLKVCEMKQEYRETLETKLKEKTKQQSSVTNITNNQNNTINLNISAEVLRKFGEENTDHITNAYLRRVIGRLGVTLPKVVSTVAKQIYCDDSRPENKTVQITNVRSQWAKVSNGNVHELQPLGDSVKGVRNKVTDLYVERQCDNFEYFKKVNARIEKLDDLNNQNYTARTLEDKEDQKNACKLKSEIDREIKSTLYNVQKQIVTV